MMYQEIGLKDHFKKLLRNPLVQKIINNQVRELRIKIFANNLVFKKILIYLIYYLKKIYNPNNLN